MKKTGRKIAVVVLAASLAGVVIVSRFPRNEAAAPSSRDHCVELEFPGSEARLVCGVDHRGLVDRAVQISGILADCRHVPPDPLPDRCTLSTLEIGNGTCRLVTVGRMKGSRRLTCGRGLDPNHDTVEDLALLPGIGEVRASAIVRWRSDNGSFGSPEDLTRVKGIGEKTVERVRPWLDMAQRDEGD